MTSPLQIIKALIPGRKFLHSRYQYFLISRAKNIILGAGETTYPHWTPTNRGSLNILDRSNFERYWKPSSRCRFLAEHVWEHFTIEEAQIANANCFEFLKEGGNLRIAVPDGLHPDPAYIDYVRPGGTGPGAEDHKVLYNYRVIQEILQHAGFNVRLLEYWDEKREFHLKKWSLQAGHISRSKQYDPRNQGGDLKFTSLILDARKD